MRERIFSDENRIFSCQWFFPQGIPCVSLSPVIIGGQTGYQVRAEIFIDGEEKN